MTTEVSMSPRAWRPSGTWCGILIDHGVDVFPKARGYYAWRAGEGSQDSFGRHEYSLANGDQLADRYAIPYDDEGLPPVQGPHDSSAFVAELSLGDPSAHGHRL